MVLGSASDPTPPDVIQAKDQLALPAETGSSSASSAHKMAEDDLAGLPRLDYRIHEHWKKLSIITLLFVLESSLVPVVLYYALTRGSSLRPGIIFAIITSFFGFVSGIEYAHRSWRLILKSDKYRPIGSKKWRFDFTHWTLGAAYTVMTALLIGASIPHPPLIRPLAMPVHIFFIQVGAQCIIMAIMALFGVRTKCRVSSVPEGEPMPPLLLILIEDIVGNDGGGGREYRMSLHARYKASKRFRNLINGLNWFWGLSALAFGGGMMAVIWIIPEDIAYGVAWGAPLGFVALWTLGTTIWVIVCLRTERRMWAKERPKNIPVEKPDEQANVEPTV